MFVDANVLYAMPLCDTVLRLAERDVFRLLLSEAVLEEAIRNLVSDGRCTAEKGERRRAHILSAFEESFVTGYEPLIDAMTCDLKDRHVLAAAIVGGANQIVTENVRDFPVDSTDPYGIEVVTPDTFLQNVLDLYPQQTLEEITDQAACLKRPQASVHQVLAALSRSAPNFAQNAVTAFAARRGGLGTVSAAAASELSFGSLARAREHGLRAELRDPLLFASDTVVIGFARNAGLGRSQALVARLRPHLEAGLRGIAVFGAQPMQRDLDDLAANEIGAAWAHRWNPTIQFAGTDLAHQLAPWLF